MERDTLDSSLQSSKTKTRISLTSVFVYNPTLKPPKHGPQDEDAIQDAKIMFFFPHHYDQHEKRK